MIIDKLNVKVFFIHAEIGEMFERMNRRNKALRFIWYRRRLRTW